MTTIIGRIKGYDTNNVIISVPGQKDKIGFIEAPNRQSTKENFPVGTEVKITMGDTKTTKGTVINIDHLTPDQITSLAKKELTVLGNEVPGQTMYTTDEVRAFLPGNTKTPKEYVTEHGEIETSPLSVAFTTAISSEKKEMVPDVNVSVRDALIAQENCLNRAVEIYEQLQPIDMIDPLPYEMTVDGIIKIKDLLFADIWLKSGMTMKEKKV